jgi:hypothetical protein
MTIANNLLNSFIQELQDKVPNLQEMLSTKENPISCYFYINIQSDIWYITLNIFENFNNTYKIRIYPDTHLELFSPLPKAIHIVVNTWLESLNIVKERQPQRGLIVKDELITNVCDESSSFFDLQIL